MKLMKLMKLMKMPKISNKDIVLSIIHDYIKKSKSFTTHDVCASAKTYGCSLDNFKIKCIVKSAYYPIHYKITPIVINDSVFDVYHKDNVDPNIYNSAIVRKRFKKIPNVKRIKRMSSFDTSKQSKAELLELLKNGGLPARYVVPSGKLREAGFRAGDPIQMTFTKTYIELVAFKTTPLITIMKRLPKYACKVDVFNCVQIRSRFFIEQFESVEILDIVSTTGSVKIFVKT